MQRLEMFSIEDQIDVFADPAFNPKAEAQRFFASNGESEVNRKLNEMSGIQVSLFTLFLSFSK